MSQLLCSTRRPYHHYIQAILWLILARREESPAAKAAAVWTSYVRLKGRTLSYRSLRTIFSRELPFGLIIDQPRVLFDGAERGAPTCVRISPA
jgi:hypothetical protein